MPAHAASNDEIAELKAMVQKLQAQIDRIEKEKVVQVAAKPDSEPPADRKHVEVGTLPGSIMIPGTNTSLKIYAQARFASTYDFGSRQENIGAYGWGSNLAIQPLVGSPAEKRHGQTYTSARESRFGFIASTPTQDWGPIIAKVEGDFDGHNANGENSTLVRLREAYVQAGNLLIGQTYSTFIDLNSLPDIYEWNGLGIAPTIRQAMVRYTQPLMNGRANVTAAVENSIGTSYPSGASGVVDFDTSYDFIVRYDQKTDWGSFSLRGVTMQYKNTLGEKWGYGLAASTRVNLSPKDSIVALVEGGDGIGRYLYNGNSQQAINTSSGMHLWRGWGAHLSYGHSWSDKWRSAVAVAYTRFEKDDQANAAQIARFGGPLADLAPNSSIRQMFINTTWAPERNYDFNLEYTYGKRETFQGDEGKISRLTGTVRYLFE